MRKLSMMMVGVAVLVLSAALAAGGQGRGPGGGRGGGQGGQRRERARERFAQQLPDDIKALLAKWANGEELTADEKAKLKEFREGVRERVEKWLQDHPGVALRQAMRERCVGRLPDEVRQLIRKYRNGEQLSVEEQTKLREFRDKLCERLKQLLD
jgi:hypothetical protein